MARRGGLLLAVLGVALPIGLGTGLPGGSQASAAVTAAAVGHSFAVIGDTPYGAAALAAFPAQVDRINADPAVGWVAHLGDLKGGSTPCSGAYYTSIKQNFDRFADPLVYTPGDNDWTDCHRPDNGSYDPLDRLSRLRGIFFARPGYTLGQAPIAVTSQAASGLPENVRWRRSAVSFAALHIVGSRNDLSLWTGRTAVTTAQKAEVDSRTTATVQFVRDTFATARAQQDKAVVLLTQADMFNQTIAAPTRADVSPYVSVVTAIAQESARFPGPVYLFNGDSHTYRADQPLAAGSKWLAPYGLAAVPNLTRVVVDGDTLAKDYLRVGVDPASARVLTWQKVAF